ncbi:CPBP family intramembrane glutamic endopeptidase [Tepidiforma sp.]|uniref:CPBP family intramembrane glutamic endopeptidase n=1 Tax=Tepidiforma sp. TaxID=2682230 RepID=UPI00261FFBD3|nr:CPBP family intramembrane glutamic endopeptidase [Tepidiforma sp.]MCX7617300.1 CPBP family intramembrane metalloprotease [Tepidiforma sp.]
MNGRLRPAPWSELHVLAGLWLAVLAYVIPFFLIQPVANLFGAQAGFRDAGDAFEKAARVASWADLALARAAAGNPLPEPPRLLGDPVAARVAWVMALVSSALFVAVALLAPRRPLREVLGAVGLDRFDAGRLWLPALCVAIAYPLTGLYAAAVRALGLGPLIPSPSPEGLEPVLRDPAALALYGLATVVAAPVSEEAVYRGLAFTGTLRWGFWPAAAFSSALFALSHRELATLLPFFAIGLVIAWLYARSGSLWDAVAFHVLFNGLSFILLLARY